MAQLVNPIESPETKTLDVNRGSGRIIRHGADITSIEDIQAIEQQNTFIQANKYDRFLYDFGAWRKRGVAPVSREEVLLSCRCQF